MKKCYMIYKLVNGDCFPRAICASESDAEEICLAFAQEELYNRLYIDSQFAEKHGRKTIFTTENILTNMNFEIMEVPFFE